MRMLIADDDPVSRRVLQDTLTRSGYDLDVVNDGEAAWEALRRDNGPPIATLNWAMPGLDGLEVCRRVRQMSSRPTYLILVTARGDKESVVRGLQAGADDYVTKPFEADELRARVQVGERVLGLQLELADRVRELVNALAQVKRLRRLLPICSYCKKVRDDKNYWHEVENYITEHSEARFSHSICPDCSDLHVKPLMESPGGIDE